MNSQTHTSFQNEADKIKTKADLKLKDWNTNLKKCSSSFKAVSREQHQKCFGEKTNPPDGGKYSPNYDVSTVV